MMKKSLSYLTLILSVSSYGLHDPKSVSRIAEDSFISRSTVKIMTGGEDENTISNCTATFLRKNILLTAAHCVDNIRGGSSLGIISFKGQNMKASFTSDDFDVYLHPLANKNTKAHGNVRPGQILRSDVPNDIALIHLKKEIDELSSNISLVTLAEKKFPKQDKTKYYYVGTGHLGTLKEYLRNLNQEQMEALATTGLSDKKLLTFLSSLYSELRAATATRNSQSQQRLDLRLKNKAQGCQGDSGGPTLIFENGRFVQVGVHSVANRKGLFAKKVDSCSTKMSDTPIYLHRQWIEQVIAQIETNS